MAREKGSKNKMKPVDGGKHSKNIENFERQLEKYGKSKVREYIENSFDYGDADDEDKVQIYEELTSLLDENKAILAPTKRLVDDIMLVLGADDEENNSQKRYIRGLAEKNALVEERTSSDGVVVAGQPDDFKVMDSDLDMQIVYYEQRLTSLKYEKLRRMSADYRVTLEIMIDVMKPHKRFSKDSTCDYQSQEVDY
jgi:hypothetical protein